MKPATLGTAVLLLTALGCGGTPAVTSDDRGDDATTDAFTDPFADVASPFADADDWDRPPCAPFDPPCPAGMPALGTSCTGPTAACEYDTDAGCIRSVSCANGIWKLGPQDCTWPLAGACPAAPQDAMDASCNEYGKRCDYPDASCGCSPDAGAVWRCGPKSAACPARPRLGAPCGSVQVVCADPLVRCYPSQYLCTCGQWEYVEPTVPPPPPLPCN